MNKKNIIVILLIICAFVVRLYKIDNPVADWHSWRQADTSAVTRNFVTIGFNPLMPRYDDLSNIQTGQDNPMGYRFVEFPLYNSVSYFLILLFGNFFTYEVWQRLVTIGASLVSLLLIYKITKYYASFWAGIAAAFFFAFLPFSVFYSRVILPGPFMVALSLGSIYTFIIWSEKREKHYLFFLSALLAAAAILVRPFAVFFFPTLLYAMKNTLFTKKTIQSLLLYAAIALAPFMAWRLWIMQFPEGIPASDWLFNKDGVRFKGAFFYWIFGERISTLILGHFGIFLMILGMVFQSKHVQIWFFHMLGLSMLFFLFIFAGGNVQHDYYQIIIIPILCMYMGVGVDFIVTRAKNNFNYGFSYAVVIAVVLLTFSLSWFEIRGYYWVNNPVIVTAGKKADELLPKEAKVIAPYGGDTAFLYQTGRQGWPVGFGIEDKVIKGATHYVSVNPTDAEVTYVKEKYNVLYEGDGFIIISLQ